MDEWTTELYRALVARGRVDVVRLLKVGVEQPEVLARRLDVTRQAVDRHLKELYRLGLVSKRTAFTHDGRPRVYFKLTRAARDLIKESEILAGRHWENLREEHLAEKRNLQRQLIMGELDEIEYQRRLEDLGARYQAFLPASGVEVAE